MTKEEKEQVVPPPKKEWRMKDSLISLMKDHESDLEALKEYEPLYDYYISTTKGEGTNNNNNKKCFAVTEEELDQFIVKTEDDFMAEQQDPNIRIGIRAVLRSMTTREKVAEWKRWCNDILGHSHTPDQPTFYNNTNNDNDTTNANIFYHKERRALREKLQKEAEMDRQLKEEMFGGTDDEEDDDDEETPLTTEAEKQQ